MSADEKYPLLNRENLTIPSQMQLSEKQNTFSESPGAFSKSTLNFDYFEKTDEALRFFISEIMVR